MQEIRERIKDAIIKSGMTQTEIGRLIGVGQRTISEYVCYKSLPALDTLAKLCIALDVSADYILGIEDYSGKKKDRI